MGDGKVLKRKAKIILMIFCVFTLVYFRNTYVKAESNIQTTSEGLKIRCDYYEKQAVVTGYSGSPTVVNIPEEFDGCKVVEIEESAFCASDTIEIVNLPKTIVKIGSSAFAYCDHLTTVNISPECTINEIEDEVFRNCEKLSELNLPTNGFEIISSYAFYNCSSLRMFSFGKNTKEIHNGAFEKCDNLSEVTFNEGLQSIGNYAFSGCTSIKSVDFPNSINEIGGGAFLDCENLKSATNLPSLYYQAFCNCTSLSSVSFQNTSENISENAFENTSIDVIIIPKSVKQIREKAFLKCNNLKKVYVLSKNISIAYSAFSSNSKLELFGFAGSGTEECAKQCGLSFTSIEETKLTCKENKEHEVQLSWSDIENVIQYDVYRGNAENGEYSLLTSLKSDVHSYIDSNVTRGKRYFYYVSAKRTLDDGIIIDVPSATGSVSIKKMTLKVSTESLVVNYFDNVTLSYTEVGTVMYEIQNPSIVSVEWVGEFYDNKVKMKITGLKKGKTKIIISNSKNDDIVSIDVTVDEAIPSISKVKGTKWKKEKIEDQEGDGVTYIFSWNKISGVTGYEVMVYEKEWEWYPYKKITNENRISVSFSSLTGLKAKVRAYKVIKGKKYYGAWSSVKKAKIRY